MKRSKYLSEIRNTTHYRDYHKNNPQKLPDGTVIQQNITLALYPTSSAYEFTEPSQLIPLWNDCARERFADDGSLKAVLGFYILYQRLVNPYRWVRVPFMTGDTGRINSMLTKKGFDYNQHGLNKHDGGDSEYHNRHFHNRLFDRDTLILSHYDLNFLYVVKLYAGNDSSLRDDWRLEVREEFRKRIRDLLQGEFEFRAIMPHDGIDPKIFFQENFRTTLGKVYSPYPEVNGKHIYMLALQKDSNIFDDNTLSFEGKHDLKTRITSENDNALRLLESAFYMTEPLCNLDVDPTTELIAIATSHPVVHAPAHDGDTGVQVVSGVSGGLKDAVDTSGWCPCPVAQCPDPESVKLLVLPHTMGANLYRVISGTLHKNVTEGDIKSLAGDAFKSVNFPTMPCHIWRVVEVDA